MCFFKDEHICTEVQQPQYFQYLFLLV